VEKADAVIEKLDSMTDAPVSSVDVDDVKMKYVTIDACLHFNLLRPL